MIQNQMTSWDKKEVTAPSHRSGYLKTVSKGAPLRLQKRNPNVSGWTRPGLCAFGRADSGLWLLFLIKWKIRPQGESTCIIHYSFFNIHSSFPCRGFTPCNPSSFLKKAAPKTFKIEKHFSQFLYRLIKNSSYHFRNINTVQIFRLLSKLPARCWSKSCTRYSLLKNSLAVAEVKYPFTRL